MAEYRGEEVGHGGDNAVLGVTGRGIVLDERAIGCVKGRGWYSVDSPEEEAERGVSRDWR